MDPGRPGSREPRSSGDSGYPKAGGELSLPDQNALSRARQRLQRRARARAPSRARVAPGGCMGRGLSVWGSVLPGRAGPAVWGLWPAPPPALEQLRGKTRALSAHDAHQPRLASHLRTRLGLRGKGERKEK